MGPFVLVWRLAAHDLRRRLTQSVLLLLVIAAASTLALAFALDGTSSTPWSTTRAATAGPDVMAEAYPAKHPALDELTALSPRRRRRRHVRTVPDGSRCLLAPIGLQAFVPDFGSKAKNLTTALADGRLRAVQGIARAV
jgi:hypothetical protein